MESPGDTRGFFIEPNPSFCCTVGQSTQTSQAAMSDNIDVRRIPLVPSCVHLSDDTLQATITMTIPIADLARAYDALHPRTSEKWPFPPTTSSIRRINQTLSIQLPASLAWFVSNSSACHHWLASLGEDYDSHRHILRMASRTRRFRRRALGGSGTWEYVKPASFIAINHGYDHDYDCLDVNSFDASTGEYAIQYWAPPRMFGNCRFDSFPDYMASHIRAWAKHSQRPGNATALSILGDT